MFLDLVKKRHSTRDFSGDEVKDSAVVAILESALLAPSSWGKHSVEFVVVKDRATIGKLASCKRMGAGPLSEASVAIVVIVDREQCELWIEDGAVASTYLLLAAEDLGIGACWIHMRGRQGHTGTAEEDIRDLLGIPQKYGVLNVVALGHRGSSQVKRTTDRLNFQNVHFETF